MEQYFIPNISYERQLEITKNVDEIIIRDLLRKHIRNTDIKRLKKTFKITKVKKLGGYVFEVDFKTRNNGIKTANEISKPKVRYSKQKKTFERN